MTATPRPLDSRPSAGSAGVIPRGDSRGPSGILAGVHISTGLLLALLLLLAL